MYFGASNRCISKNILTISLRLKVKKKKTEGEDQKYAVISFLYCTLDGKI